jgi:uncharacterized protein YbjT (DUF2867 family)
MKVLVIGSHGNVGQRIVRYLSGKGHEAFAMIRDASQKSEMERLGGKTVVADLEEDFSSAYDAMDAVIFTAGSGAKTGPDKTIDVDQEAAKKSIDLASEKGIKRYIMVSAIGAKKPDAQSAIQHYFKAKAIADNHLMNTSLNYTIFRPGRLTDEPGKGTADMAENLGRKGSTSREDLALTIVESLLMPETYLKTIEILDGNTPITKALKDI